MDAAEDLNIPWPKTEWVHMEGEWDCGTDLRKRLLSLGISRNHQCSGPSGRYNGLGFSTVQRPSVPFDSLSNVHRYSCSLTIYLFYEFEG